MSESSVEAELVKLTKVRKKKGESDNSYLSRMVTKVTALDDEIWEKMSAAAQEWSNEASKAFSNDEDIPALPLDDEEEEEDADDAEDDDEDEDGEDDDDSDEDDDDEDDGDDDEEEEDEKPKKKSKAPEPKSKVKPAAKPAAKVADKKSSKPKSDDGDAKAKTTKPAKAEEKSKKGIQKPAAEVGETKKPRGGGVAIKEIMIKDPNISLPDLVERLQKKNFALTEFTVAAIRSEFRQTLRVLNDLGCLSEELAKRLAKKKPKD